MNAKETARQSIGENSITASQAKALLELLGYMPTDLAPFQVCGGWRFNCGATVVKLGQSKVFIDFAGYRLSAYIADIVALEKRINLQVSFRDGNSLQTGFNGTALQVANYYYQNTFELIEGQPRTKGDYLVIEGTIHLRPLV